jgi:hypothetical protein
MKPKTDIIEILRCQEKGLYTPVTIYLAGNSASLAVSSPLKDLLERELSCKVLLPQDILPPDSTVGIDRHHVFHVCKTMIDRAQILLVSMVSFGRDTSAEIGYGFATGKIIIGYGYDLDRVPKNDFIVLGFIHHIVANQAQLLQLLRNLLGRLSSPTSGVAPV